MSVEPQAGSVQRLLGSQLELDCQAEASPALTGVEIKILSTHLRRRSFLTKRLMTMGL